MLNEQSTRRLGGGEGLSLFNVSILYATLLLAYYVAPDFAHQCMILTLGVNLVKLQASSGSGDDES